MEAWLMLTARQVLGTLAHNWPFLVAGTLVAAVLQWKLDPQRVAGWLERHRRGAVFSATGLAVATPLCSCGTMAVILGMMASTVPWAPVVAFMVASPLTSPTELVYSAGLFGWPFAGTFFGASIALGVAGGFAAMALERRGWLAGQARLAPVAAAAGGCVEVEERAAGSGGCSCGAPAGGCDAPAAAPPAEPAAGGLAAVLRQTGVLGARLFALFFVFAFVGYGLNNLIPASWVPALFGSGHRWGVPLAATLGLPLYVNTDASLPLVRAFLDNGASAGAALAFLITGAGTSVGAVAGALAIARIRVIALVVGTLWLGAIVFGVGYDLLAVG